MAIAPVNKVTPAFVEQLNDNFSTIKTAVDAVEATAADTLTKSANLAGLASTETARGNLGLGTIATENTAPIAKGGTGATDAMAAVVNLSAPARFANVAALSTPLTTVPASLIVEGQETPGDGGGFLGVYDAASAATIDNILTYPSPNLIGRVINPVDGILQTKSCGLKDSTVADQSARLQDYLHILGEPLSTGKSYKGVISPGVIDCAGATIYATRDGAGAAFYSNAMALSGANRRNCVIRNLTMVAGTPRWLQFTASGNVLLENFRIEGRLHLQNMEGNSVIRGVTVARAPLDTLASPLVSDLPTTPLGTTSSGVPGDPATGVAWATWASDYMVTLYASNHPLIENLSIAGKAGSGIPSGDYRKGFLMYGNANARVFQGTVYGCDPGVVIDAGLSIRNFLDGLKFEECEGTHIWLRGGSDNVISTWHRLGSGHGLTAPLIRLGETGVSTATNTLIEKALMFSDQVGLGTAIKCERVVGLKVRDSHFTDFSVGVDTGASNVAIGTARVLADIWVDPQTNTFENVTTDVSRGARTQRNDTADITPWPIVNSATTVWSGYNGLVQTLSTNASRTINVGEMANGQTYTLFIKKGALAHVISWAGDALTWEGAAPDFAAMTITQVAVITIETVDFGAGQVRNASYKITGT